MQPHQRVYRVYRDILPTKVMEDKAAPWDNRFLKSRSRKQAADDE
jgi:hypothetical protein